MEPNAAILDFLTDEEIQSISTEVKKKVEDVIRRKQNEFTEQKAEFEKLRVLSDQQCFDLEKQLEKSSSNLENEQAKSRGLEIRILELGNKLEESVAEHGVLKETISNYSSELETVKRHEHELAVEIKEMLQILEKRNAEIEQLKAEVSAVSKQYSTANQAKLEALLKLDEVSCHEAALQHQVKRVEHERDALAKEVENLNAEVAQSTNSLYANRTEQAHKVLDLQSKLDSATEELKLAKDVKESLQKVVEDQNTKLDKLIEQLKEQREMNIKAESQFNHELQSQVKLTNLYKDSLEESQGRTKELMAAVEEMQNLLKQAVDENNRLQRNIELEKSNCETAISETEKQISKMEQELLRANDLICHMRKNVLSESDVENLSPSAAAASRLLKSGKTLTEIYVEYIDLTDQLQVEKDTNARLNMYLTQILKEIEDKAPCLKKQRDDYENALEALSVMTQQLNKSVKEHESLQSNLKESERTCRLLKQENDSLKVSCDDLGKQVCSLLKQIEESAGNLILEDDNDVTQVVSSTVTNVDSAVSENFVVFRNVKELQMQNQKLLTTIRELTVKHEQEENEAYTKQLSELRGELDEAVTEISKLREFQDKHCEMIKSLIRQRDMYRVLLAQSPNGNEVELSLGGSGDIKSKQPHHKDESAVALQQLQEEFTTYKSKSRENQNALMQQLEKLKEERMELRLYSSKLSSQLDFKTESYNTLKSNYEGYKREISVLRTRNEQLSNLSAKHEEAVASLRNELRAMQDRLSRAEVSVENLRQERQLLKQSEVRLLSENEALTRERSGQALVLANLQAIQNNLEKAECESKALLANRISALEREASALQSKLDREHERAQLVAQTWEKERQDLLKRVQEESEKNLKSRDELVSAYSTVHELRQEALATREKLKSMEALVAKGGQTSTQEQAASAKPVSVQDKDDDLSLELKEAQTEIANLKSQLKKSSEHLLQFKSISSSLEDEIKQQNLASKKFQEDTEKILNTKDTVISNLEKEVAVLKQENDKLLKERHDTQAENFAKVSDGRMELHKATVDLQNTLQALEDCKRSEQEAKQEFQVQSKLLKEVQDKYEKEVVHHATAIKTLDELRKKFEHHDERQTRAEELARKAEYALKDGLASWKAQETILKEQLSHLESKAAALEEQNARLHGQMEQLSGQMIALQSKDSSNLSVSFESPSEESVEHLMEIIRFLRKEKDIYCTKCDVLVAENDRLSTKAKFLEKRLDESEQLLRELQEKEQVSLATSGQHAELMRRVELLNVLSDGNRVLREEKNELIKKIREMEIKITQLESEVNPLKERNQELGAKYDSIYAERKALEGEAKRWQIRTQHLIEQSSRSSHEEFKKALHERDQFQKQVATMKEENARLKAEVSSLESSATTLRKDLDNLKNELQSKVREITRLTEESESKDNQLVEVNKNLQQVRKIGRKYKAQYDELKAQVSDTSTKAAEEVPTEPVPNLAEAVEAAKQEARQEMEAKLKEAEQQLNANQEKVKKLRQTAYQRITLVATQRDEVVKELKELKAKAAQAEALRSGTSKSEIELRVSNLETQLTDARNRVATSTKERDELKKEVEDLTLKFTQQQKHIESLQKQLKDASNKLSSSSGSSRDNSILAQPSSDVSTPPTANIKPMATPGGSVVRHPHPSGGASRQTPMGRIRPISAVSPAANRMATIIPTTASVNIHLQHQEPLEDVHQTPAVALQTTSLPQATVAPTPAVAISSISPVVHDAPQHPVAQHHHSSLVEDALPLPAADDGTSNVMGDDDKSLNVQVELSSGAEEGEIPQIASPDREPAAGFTCQESLKRSRDELEGDVRHDAFGGASLKKRICAEEMSSQDPAMTLTQPSTSQAAEVLQKSAHKPQPDVDDQEVILVESDSDEDDNERMEADDVDGADDDGEEQSLSDNYDEDDDQNNEEFQDDSANIEEEHFRDSNDEEGDVVDNEIEIIEHTEEDEEEESQVEGNIEPVQPSEREESGTGGQSQSCPAMFLPRLPARSERFPPSLNRQQPVPYSSVTSNTGFEDGDSIVPSTPTLFDPRRNDGFAEAISSPHVPPERFLFGSTVETPSQLASQGALGVDDTRMDLTQFDEGSGRSVPSTPLQVSPLDTASADMPSDILNEGAAATAPRDLSEDAGQVQGSLNVPAITITSEEGGESSVQPAFSQSDSEAVSPLIEVPETATELDQSTSEGPVIVSTSSLETGALEEVKDDPDNETSMVTQTETEGMPAPDTSNVIGTPDKEGTSSQQGEQPQRRTTPIIWDSPRPPLHGRPPARGRQQMSRPYVRRTRPPLTPMQQQHQHQQHQQRMGFRHMGRGGRMPPRGRPPYPHQRH